MSSKTLRAAYGASSTRQAIARAIRAEIENGEQIMLAEINASARVQRDGLFIPVTIGTGAPQLTAAGRALSKAREAREEAENEIRRRYDMPPLTGQAAWRVSREAR